MYIFCSKNACSLKQNKKKDFRFSEKKRDFIVLRIIKLMNDDIVVFFFQNEEIFI